MFKKNLLRKYETNIIQTETKFSVNSQNIIYSHISINSHVTFSDSARHRSQDMCPPISQIVMKNFIKISSII